MPPLAVAAVIQRTGQAKPVFFEELEIILIAHVPRERARADGREQSADKPFAARGRFVAQIVKMWIANHIVAVREKKMRGRIRVVGADGLARLAHAHVLHPGVAINRSEIRTAHRAILIQQQLRTEQRAVVVQSLRVTQIADGIVHLIVLRPQQPGIKPRGRIIRIKFFCEAQIFFREFGAAFLAPRLREIAAQQRAVRLQRRSGLQILPALGGLAETNLAQAAAQPRVTERAVNGHRVVKKFQRGLRTVLRGGQKTAQRDAFRIARGIFQSGVQCGFGGSDAAKAEFQFCDAHFCKTERRRFFSGLACGGKRGFKFRVRL